MNIFDSIEHTLLDPLTNRESVIKLCDEALLHNFLGVCIPPYLVRDAVRKFDGLDKITTTVIGFPLGYTFTNVKVEEIKKVIDEGADEVDVVLNLAAVKSKEWSVVKNEIDSVTMAAHMRGKKVKLIVEVDYLSDEELMKVLTYCIAHEVDFVKTSTGYSKKAITPEKVAFLRANLPESIGVKASGGIKTKEAAIALLQAGATRIGTSSSLQLI